MNDAGLAVGNSSAWNSAGDYFSRAVMWSADGMVIDLGMGGRVGPDAKVHSSAVDVNEQGDVVAQRFYDPAGKESVQSSWLWRDGVKLRLRATKRFPAARVEALNDLGVAVGYLEGTHGGHSQTRPAAWVNGKLVRLPIPQGATGAAKAINNNNLIVGSLAIDASGAGHAWFWRLNGRSGPLPANSVGEGSHGAFEVDNQNRILGAAWPTQGLQGVVWPAGPSSTPYSYGGGDVTRAADMNDHGDLTGSRSWGRDDSGNAWVSQIGANKAVNLPVVDARGRPGKSFGMAVIRGVTWFAPDGGVSVGGGAASDANDWHATIWTCTQTYRH